MAAGRPRLKRGPIRNNLWISGVTISHSVTEQITYLLVIRLPPNVRALGSLIIR
jgi:hypothetical protein